MKNKTLRSLLVVCTVLAICLIFLFLILFLHFKTEDEAYLNLFKTTKIENRIEQYLTASYKYPNPGSKMFCSYKLFGVQGIEDKDEVYIWKVCEEYKSENNKVVNEYADSGPVALTFKENEIIKTKQPGDGTLYTKDIAVIFPKYIQRQILNDGPAISETLQVENKNKAEKYFQIK